jgi:hypothetical protein
MDTLRRANLLEVVTLVQQKMSESTVSDDSAELGESPESVETPLDYSMMNRKRRLLNTYDGASNAKKTLDYGSDGHSDDRSSSGSPLETGPDSGSGSLNTTGKDVASSPEMDETRQTLHNIQHHPRLHELPMLHHVGQQQQQQQHAAALSLFLQAQHQQQHQKQQHVERLQPFLRLSAMGQQAQNNGWTNDHIASPPLPGTPSPASLELARATHESQQKFVEFRENLLRQIESSRSSTTRRSTSPSLSISPSPMCDSGVITPSQSGDKDSAYWERRRKNNEAAKRSRDARRAKEQDIALRAQFLEQENIQLKLEVAHLRAENAQFRGQFHHMHNSSKN